MKGGGAGIVAVDAPRGGLQPSRNRQVIDGAPLLIRFSTGRSMRVEDGAARAVDPTSVEKGGR
eukprot:6221172-Pyramimonas_sp.AAC.1